MANAFIGLGGNVGDSRQILTDAVVCLAQIPFIQINARSCFYISKPVDAPGEDYINNVIAISTTLEPLPFFMLAKQLKSILVVNAPLQRHRALWILTY